tara:strand:+ start:290 stop:1204 length:915 start_codon:yes stop_codon:yes gene_type:complete
MTISLKRSGGYTIPDKIFVKEDGLWKECIGVYANKDGTWTQVFVNNVTITLSGLVKNINIWDEVVARIGSVPYPVVANVILNSGCNIVDDATNSTIPYTFAFTDGDFSAGSVINLTLNTNATITGRGGNGGFGTASENNNGQSGQPGTNAIYTRTPIVINNSGVIGGGGGGGGGGNGQRTYHAAGNGGGGAGGYHQATSSFGQNPNTSTQNFSIPASYGGIGAGPRAERNYSPKAANGTILTGGAGSASSEGGNSRKGGNGGDIGQNGVTGTGGSYGGGQAGYAVDGYSYLTFTKRGTFVGKTK